MAELDWNSIEVFIGFTVYICCLTTASHVAFPSLHCPRSIRKMLDKTSYFIFRKKRRTSHGSSIKSLQKYSKFPALFGGWRGYQASAVEPGKEIDNHPKMAEVKLNNLLRLYRLRSKFDAVILAVHACLAERGFRCINSGEEVRWYCSIIRKTAVQNASWKTPTCMSKSK